MIVQSCLQAVKEKIPAMMKRRRMKRMMTD